MHQDSILAAVLTGLLTAAAALAQSPATPPAAAPCDPVTAKVYFERDRSNLPESALATIDALVALVRNARNCTLASIHVTGYADTSASTEDSQAISERRASAVKDAMVARGVLSAVFAVHGRGETELERATPDGVSEPLNRRAVVTITFQ
jgi:outer membrane protein OmpA-like peptidoglycan-associated protein